LVMAELVYGPRFSSVILLLWSWALNKLLGFEDDFD